MTALRFTLLFCALATGLEEPLNTWQDVLLSNVFQRFADSLADKKGLDVLISDTCVPENNTVAFYGFFKGMRVPVAVWTDERVRTPGLYKERDSVSKDLRRITASALIIVCDFPGKWKAYPGQHVRHSVARTAYMLSEAFNRPISTDYQLKRLISNACSYTDVLNVTLIRNRLYLTDVFAADCISCNSSRPIRHPLFREIPLNGSSLDILCYEVSCSNADVDALVESLQHKNGIVRRAPLNVKRRKDDTLMFNGTTIHVLYPGLTYVVHAGNYDAYTTELFIEGRLPLPKEIVLVLPFTPQVWWALLSALVTCAAATVLISFCKGRSASITEAFEAYVFTFLQQDHQLPSSILRHNSARIIIGWWSILVLVLGTGFRGQLTALLRNIPLQSGIERFSQDLKNDGYRLCYMGLSLRTATSDATLPKTWCVNDDYYGLRPRGYKEIHGLDSVPSRMTEQHRNELFRTGFAQLSHNSPVFHVGPRLTPTSPYLRAVKNTVTQGVESGMYVRARSLFSFNISLWSPSLRGTKSAAEEPLTLTDLRPYFIVWAAGTALSVVAFLSELAVFRVKRTRAFSSSCKLLRVAKRRLTKRQLLTKLSQRHLSS